jgi:hypothetical protein
MGKIMTLDRKTLLVTLRVNIEEKEMDQQTKDELKAMSDAAVAHGSDPIDHEDSGFSEVSPQTMAGCLEQGLIENPEVFAGSMIWAQITQVSVVSAEFE